MTFGKKNSIEAAEADLEQVLSNFRVSVEAWSEAEYGRPRSLAPAALHRTWRRAAAWALGCVLAAGGLGAGLYERQHQQELARMAAERQAQQQRMAAQSGTVPTPAVQEAPVEQVAQAEVPEADESLLATVDSDVSRQVPSAMEPLAQLMDSDSSK